MSIENGRGLCINGATGRYGWNNDIAGWNVGRGEGVVYDEGDGEGKDEGVEGRGEEGDKGLVTSKGELEEGEDKGDKLSGDEFG